MKESIEEKKAMINSENIQLKRKLKEGNELNELKEENKNLKRKVQNNSLLFKTLRPVGETLITMGNGIKKLLIKAADNAKANEVKNKKKGVKEPDKIKQLIEDNEDWGNINMNNGGML